MPGYKAIGQVGLGGFLYAAAAKLISKVSNYIETDTPAPTLAARYHFGDSAPLSLPDTVLLTPSMSQNVTATITPPLTLSPPWTIILTLWSALKTIVNFAMEQCDELITELVVHLLFVLAMAFFGSYIDKWLMRVLGHPKATILDDDSLSMWIQLLDTLAEKVQDRFNNVQAAIANLIDGITQAITDLCTELVQAENTITGLERELADARDKDQEQINNHLADSRQRIKDLEAEQADLSTKHNDALRDGQTKLKEADEKFNRLEKMFKKANNKIEELEAHLKSKDKVWEAKQADLSTKHDKALKDSQTKLKKAGEQSDILEKNLSEANDKIEELEVRVKSMDNHDSGPADDGHTETEDKKLILKLTIQRNHWQAQLEQYKTDTDEKIEKAVETAKKNADKAAERRQEIANVRAADEIKQLKAALETKEMEFDQAKKQSAEEITALKEALAKKKEEDDKPAPSFNPAATVFMPSPEPPTHSTLPSSPHTSIPATPFSPSPSAASFSPSPSPNPTTLYQQPPIKKGPMPEHARQNLDEINRKLREKKDQVMMGKPVEDAELKPLSEEELGKSM